MKNALILIFAFTMNAVANILMKMVMTQADNSNGLVPLIKSVITRPLFWCVGLSFGAALGAYGLVLSRVNLSIAYPVMVSMGLIIVVLASHFLFKENITLAQLGGFLLILGGVWLVAK